MVIRDHMGKESSFLPPEMQSYPSPQILSHLYVGKDSSPFKMQNPYKSFPTKSVLYLP